MQDLSSDIIGTNPSFPKLVDHGWLTPNPATYDNYPSDNNPVRIGPKLADIWNTGADPSINLIPNCTVQQLGVQSSDKRVTDTVASVVREAKKAMMAGVSGHGLTEYLRARFASEDIIQAKTALSELSNEQGLLGNVYIDASAFSSANEAEQFMNQHRTRLAQDIVINGSVVSANVIGYLANKFRKNVLASVDYNAVTFKKYKDHLVASGKISNDYVIDSKESLRAAFMAEPVVEVEAKAKPEPKFDPAVMEKLVKTDKDKQASEEVLFRKSQPILEFARAQLVKGKSANALKEMLRGKYATQDLNDAAKYLAVVCAEAVNLPEFTAENIDALVASNKITGFVGTELKRLASKYPFKRQAYVQEQKSEKQIGITAEYEYHALAPVVSDNFESYRRASIEALRKGLDVYAIRAKLARELPMESADKVISEAMASFNANAVGIKVNAPEKVAKKKVVSDLIEREALPDPSTIAPASQEILSFFDGSESMDFDINAPAARESLEISGLFNKEGLDSII